ncbi:MAG: hemerythrin domain-containing protein [Gemmatimonadetes bacterium]|nr:hemerythrin domain-containing protein [Gemmatimonadota bacterium]
MCKAIEMLMREHRFIETMLNTLEVFAERLEPGTASDRVVVRDFGDFFAEFADRCHHGKEEEGLFRKMEEHGIPNDHGPIAVMLSDHREGREHVAVFHEVGAGDGPLSPEECEAVKRHATQYADHLRAHIQKEDNVLYPMSEQLIPDEEMDRLARDFERFEEDVMGAGAHERYHEMGRRLARQYPRAAESGAASGLRR